MKQLLPTYPCLAKFLQFVELKDYRPRTKETYFHYVRKLAEHVQCDPSTLSQDQLREYFLFLRQHKKFGGSSMHLARASLRSFFRECLKIGVDWTSSKSPPCCRPCASRASAPACA
jgi:hypothetical protein